MIERVGNAIQHQMGLDDNMPEDLARAAIQAMREPAVAMLDAVTPEGMPGFRTYQVECKQFWQRMIDAALEEKK